MSIELLSAYIDSEVTSDEARRIERHLPTCTRCTEELESLRWTVDLLREIPPVPVPRPFIVRQVDIEPEPARRRFTLSDWLFNSLQWATVATAVLAILVLSMDFLGGSRPATPSALLQAPQAEKAASEMAQEARELEMAEEVAPLPADTVQVEREEALGLASGPPEAPAATQAGGELAPSFRRAPAVGQGEGAVENEAPAEPAQEQAQDDTASEPLQARERADQTLPATQPPMSQLRFIGLGLVGLFVILLGLTLWARTRRTG